MVRYNLFKVASIKECYVCEALDSNETSLVVLLIEAVKVE